MANDDIDLMQHADGELDEREVTALEARLASDPEARTKAEALGQMSELVRGHLELAVDAVPAAKFDAMWKAIDDAVPSTAPARAKRPESGRERGGVWGWFERYRGYILTSVVSAGAVAALAIILRGNGTSTTIIQRGALEVQPAAMRTAPEIEEMDVPEGEGTVLNLEDEDGHTTVIWVSPADTVEGI